MILQTQFHNAFLRVCEKQIGVEGQCALGETLRYAYLEFHIRVCPRRSSAKCSAKNKIVVAEQCEIRPVVKTVHVCCRH